MMISEYEARSGCPISTSLEFFGDRWTLIIIRDMLNGKKKYSEFLSSPERITTNILANRLNKIILNGLANKKLYQTNPKRYEYILTDKGMALHPMLQDMCRWGNQYYPDTWVAPEGFMKPK